MPVGTYTMTELVDLIENPKQKLTTVFDAFIRRLNAEHEREERNLDRLFEHHRLKLHRRHLKTVSAYKHILEELYVDLNKNTDALLIDFCERFWRAEDRSPFKEVLKEALPVLDKVQKEGGRIDMSIKHYDSSKISSGDCLFSYDPNGHFDFLDEFLEGFDDFEEYKVVKMHKDTKKKKEEDEARLQQTLAEIRAKEPPQNETILAASEDLKNEPPAFE